jgi:hypothetical protein
MTRLPDTHALRPPGFPRQPVLGWRELGRGRAALPSLLDLKHSVRTRSGRSALLLALENLGVGPGERVLVPTYHCPTMIAPVERLGAIPVFYPLTPGGEPDLDFLRGTHGAARALLAAHLFGLPIDMRPIADFCRSRGMALIEDCAHCFFGRRDSTAVGTTGEFAIGSLPKFFPVVEGGVLVSARRAIRAQNLTGSALHRELRAAWDIVDVSARANRLGPIGGLVRTSRRLRSTSNRPAAIEPRPAAAEPSPQQTREEGLLDPLLMPAPLTSVESWIVDRADNACAVTARQLNFRTLADALGDVRGARPLFATCGPASAPYVMPLRLESPEGPYARMRELGLPVFRWDRLWPDTPVLPGDAGASWARSVIQIACHQSLTPEQAAAVAASVRECVLAG